VLHQLARASLTDFGGQVIDAREEVEVFLALHALVEAVLLGEHAH